MEFKKSLLGKIVLHSFTGYTQSEGVELLKPAHPGTLTQKETKITKSNYEGFYTSLMGRVKFCRCMDSGPGVSLWSGRENTNNSAGEWKCRANKNIQTFHYHQIMTCLAGTSGALKQKPPGAGNCKTVC